MLNILEHVLMSLVQKRINVPLVVIKQVKTLKINSVKIVKIERLPGKLYRSSWLSLEVF
ncbi:hypothetical protein D9M71_751310 [compost metagenome]